MVYTPRLFTVILTLHKNPKSRQPANPRKGCVHVSCRRIRYIDYVCSWCPIETCRSFVRCDNMMMDWSELLESFRTDRRKWLDHKAATSDDEIVASKLWENAQPRFRAVAEQLARYGEWLQQSSHDKTGNDSAKLLIRDTRNALRFGILCLSLPNDSIRVAAQTEAIRCGWDAGILRILCCHAHNNRADDDDSKCQLLAARLLSNMVTSNFDSAQAVSSQMALAPASLLISSQLRATVGMAVNNDDEQQELVLQSSPKNWVDAMLHAAKSGNRPALGAIVAALHNCLLSLLGNHATTESVGSTLIHQISSCSLLICTLLRQVASIESSIRTEDRKDPDEEEEEEDAATEWIVLLLIKLCRQGLLPSMYRAIGTNSLSLPEQVVLLHCIRSEVTARRSSTKDSSSRRPHLVLGGEAGCTESTHVFLAQVLCSLLDSQQRERDTLLKSTTTSNIDENDDRALQQSAILTILDILAETLASDDEVAAQVRKSVGRQTALVPRLCRELGELHDQLSLRNRGRISRDVLILHDEQAMLIALVRVMGNLAFECRHNQDLIRTTMVVPTDDAAQQNRSGLHVLLSCTSYAQACFTLREWAVVAIRNVLQDNGANQQVVAQLESQRAVQSTELGNMGIRVELSKGQVSVSPLVDEEESSSAPNNEEGGSNSKEQEGDDKFESE